MAHERALQAARVSRTLAESSYHIAQALSTCANASKVMMLQILEEINETINAAAGSSARAPGLGQLEARIAAVHARANQLIEVIGVFLAQVAGPGGKLMDPATGPADRVRLHLAADILACEARECLEEARGLVPGARGPGARGPVPEV